MQILAIKELNKGSTRFRSWWSAHCNGLYHEIATLFLQRKNEAVVCKGWHVMSRIGCIQEGRIRRDSEIYIYLCFWRKKINIITGFFHSIESIEGSEGDISGSNKR